MELPYPTDITFWLVVVILIAVVLLYAIWRGNINLGVRSGVINLTTTDRKDPNAEAMASSKVTVAESAEISVKVGRITGEVLSEKDHRGGEISVANSAKISGRVDEITGRTVHPIEPSKK